MSLFGPPNIEKLKSNKDLMGLVGALGYQNRDPKESDRVSSAAAAALIELKDTRSISLLLEALQKKENRARAAEVLGEMVDAQAVEHLTQILQVDGKTSTAAAIALGKIGNVQAVGPLMQAYEFWDHVSSGYTVANAIKNAIAAIGAPAVLPIINRTKGGGDWAAGQVLTLIGEPAVDPLIALLQVRDWKLQGMAATALGEIGDPRAVEPLVELLATPGVSDYVQKYVIQALDKIGWQPGQDEAGEKYLEAKRTLDEAAKKQADKIDVMISLRGTKWVILRFDPLSYATADPRKFSLNRFDALEFDTKDEALLWVNHHTYYNLSGNR